MFIMIFVLTKTQKKVYRGSFYLNSPEKEPYFRFQSKQCKLEVHKNSVCIGTMKCLVGMKAH